MPTLYSSPKAMGGRDTEPGGSTCAHCREPLEEGEHVYRELFGSVEEVKDHDIILGRTGGIVLRNYCQACYNEQKNRDKGAHYDVTDGDRLWTILEAADGELVADMRPMLVGGRAWVRVVDGDVEARHSVMEKTSQGFRFDTEPTEDFDVTRFGDYFDDPGDRTRVILKPAEETPFAKVADVGGESHE